MKRFLTGNAKETQMKRVDEFLRLATDYGDMLDFQEGLKKEGLVNTASKLIKLIKKTRKTWLSGGFFDILEMGHDEEPPFASPAGHPIPERELAANERFPPIIRPNTKHLKVKGQKHGNTLDK